MHFYTKLMKKHIKTVKQKLKYLKNKKNDKNVIKTTTKLKLDGY